MISTIKEAIFKIAQLFMTEKPADKDDFMHKMENTTLHAIYLLLIIIIIIFIKVTKNCLKLNKTKL